MLDVASPLRPAHVPDTSIVEGPRVLRRLPDGVESRPYDLFGLRPLGRVIGAEIEGVDLGRPLTGPLRAELDRALLEWKVLFFRDQDITSEQQRAFARNWGELETNPLLPQGDSDEVTRFARTESMPAFENVWHTDVTFRPSPALGSVLRLVRVPPFGGDTMWADMAAAYDNLPADVRERITGLRAVHDFVPGFARFAKAGFLAARQDEFPPVEHPVVRTHPVTGRRTLFVNPSFTTHIVGLERDESDELLRLLFAQAHVPEFQVRFRWTENAVAFWDNRATQHYAVNDYAPHVRIAERVAIAGDRPY
ncbi:taurine dioxygenase [Amycolatopsis bartoniae]|uniref:Taurine dioxygenase n=1 Tax=Amycolatopsis bartoniae TaxID=941986 RepID=A0A8H9ISB0_9PSEU|nr:TauD/TfdA family dioxygenase [Amycolatopsis bartoniae]MBB2937120.1 taurine dioxygenase [Amycolatopsis bartoniae]TVT05995.1 taurine dioxygenase [Amycolatopsis bartoniae]GHF52568.1 taurine dioxygenase [Amycolatopsis bartoniae]